MPVYLRYLQDRLAAAGGTVSQHKINSLADATDTAPLVINCTGLGAGGVAADPLMSPVRGDLLVVDQPPHRISEFFSEETGPSPDLMHIYPQPNHVILGGTALPGVASRTPDAVIAKGILERCAAVEPRLRNAEIREHRVGLRPTRPTLRLEAEHVGASSVIIHNYGHGGSGVTLSWGCSDQVLTLVEREL